MPNNDMVQINMPGEPTSKRQASELPMGDEEIAKLLTWSVDDVCGWLKKVGLDGYFEEQFRAHEISGDVLPLIELAELKDMNASVVGPRSQLLKKLSKLKRSYVGFKRNRVLWNGLEHRYECALWCVVDFLGSCCCPDPADTYNLTSSHLKLSQKVYPYGKCFRLCCKGNDINSIDLSTVLDVDSMSSSNCCGCGRDTVVIQQKDHAEKSKMFLPVGEGPQVARMVRDAVEENQASEKTKF